MELAGKFAGLLESGVIDPRFQPQFDQSSVQVFPEYAVAGSLGIAGPTIKDIPMSIRAGDVIGRPISNVKSVTKDPFNQAGLAALGIASKFIPRVGTAINIINAGPTATYDTLDPAAAAMRQRMMQR